MGTSKWIEPPEAGLFLRSHGVEAHDLLFNPSHPKQVAQFHQRLVEHFARHRTPVMIDDRVKAYCVLGVKRGDPSHPGAVTHVLRFDPHVFIYPPPPNAWGAKGVEWLPFFKVFERHSKWMVLFPTREEATQERIPGFKDHDGAAEGARGDAAEEGGAGSCGNAEEEGEGEAGWCCGQADEEDLGEPQQQVIDTLVDDPHSLEVV